VSEFRSIGVRLGGLGWRLVFLPFAKASAVVGPWRDKGPGAGGGGERMGKARHGAMISLAALNCQNLSSQDLTNIRLTPFAHSPFAASD
jgi:hypothetical protein